MDMNAYFETVDNLMKERGYTLCNRNNPHTPNESRTYAEEPSPHHSTNRISIEVRKENEFKFFYTNLRMCASLVTNWMSPITDDKQFYRMLNKFLRSVNALRTEWNDFDDLLDSDLINI